MVHRAHSSHLDLGVGLKKADDAVRLAELHFCSIFIRSFIRPWDAPRDLALSPAPHLALVLVQGVHGIEEDHDTSRDASNESLAPNVLRI